VCKIKIDRKGIFFLKKEKKKDTFQKEIDITVVENFPFFSTGKGKVR
jgi:hypothetical protein